MDLSPNSKDKLLTTSMATHPEKEDKVATMEAGHALNQVDLCEAEV